MSASASASPSPSPSLPPAPAETYQLTQNTQNAQVMRDIFGGDSDSDISVTDSEDERPKRPARQASRTPPAQASDDDDDDDEDEDVYVPATVTSAAKIPSFKKVSRKDDGMDVDGDGDEEDDDDGERRKKKRKKEVKKPKRKERRTEVVDVEEEEPVYDEATLRRRALEEKINNIGKKAKVVRRKKKADEEGDIVDSYHDEVCARLRDRMLSAADKDEISNRNKLPATSKLAMLDEVMSVLRNQTLWSSIVDNGVLEAVKRWLEPLPDRSLPAVGIQKSIFEVLPKMELDTTTLKECRLGPIVLFYTKTKRVTPTINRQADALVQTWSRPIIKRPANFRSRHIESASEMERRRGGGEEGEEEDEDGTNLPRLAIAQSIGKKKKRFDAKSAVQENVGRKGARLATIKEIQYTVAPAPQLQHHADEKEYVSRVQMDNKKFNRFARQMKSGKGGR